MASEVWEGKDSVLFKSQTAKNLTREYKENIKWTSFFHFYVLLLLREGSQCVGGTDIEGLGIDWM